MAAAELILRRSQLACLPAPDPTTGPTLVVAASPAPPAQRLEMRDIGMLPQAQLAISPTLSCHATWRAEAVEEVPVPESQLVRLQAFIVVEALRQPVLAAYDLTWTRMGPVVVGFGGEWGPDLLTPADCPK